MNQSKEAMVKVDLSPLHKGNTECHATLEISSLNRPEKLSIVIHDLTEQQVNAILEGRGRFSMIFAARQVSVRLDEGVTIETEIAMITAIDPGLADFTVHCLLGPSTEFQSESLENCRVWKMRLANYRIDVGDICTFHPPSTDKVPPDLIDLYSPIFEALQQNTGDAITNGSSLQDRFGQLPIKGSFIRNRVRFCFANREWSLDDDLFTSVDEMLADVGTPIASGTLSTAMLDGDKADTIHDFANVICDLLSFALAQDIKWISCGCFNNQGRSQSLFHRSTSLLSFNQRGSVIVDNWNLGNLKSFLEVGGPRIYEEREWWSLSIGILTQARGNKALEAKCSLLNTLLDRLTRKVIGETNTPEIDGALPTHLNDANFVTTLNSLLASLTPKWDQNRTQQLISVIKQWNTTPSFPRQIKRACDKLGIRSMAAKKLHFRHVLIHNGEMHSEMSSNEDRMSYATELEDLVLLLICRMLDFNGLIYLWTTAEPTFVSTFLSIQEEGGE